MNIDNIIDTVVEKIIDGDLVIGKYNKIPETKLIILQQTSSKWWIQVPTPIEMGIPNK
ncbi:hypothetical protein [Colwellia sp. UCD-KL20]|uniref:hypothetical protein n=1 Tax=Colwellia sp. UCD-KL20 TaxID=1917165 RepID=UPI0015C33834|nr:hypothetical protein [Colwellia sp. UCD-KL20]